MSAPTHMCTQKTHTWRHTQMHSPCGHAVFCLPASYKKKKKRLRREVKRRRVDGRGGEAERGGLICTDG